MNYKTQVSIKVTTYEAAAQPEYRAKARVNDKNENIIKYPYKRLNLLNRNVEYHHYIYTEH